MVFSEITLYNALRAKLGELEAQTVVEGIKQEVRSKFENKKYILATKEDVLNLRVDMERGFAQMERGFRDNLKWTIATIIACTSILLAILKLM